jgi:bilirubin oxidase
MRVGTRILVQNVGPDEPFGGGVPGVDFQPSDAKTTGQVMQFNVVDRVGTDTTTAPGSLVLPPLPTLGASSKTRQVSLNELVSKLDPTILDGPAEARLGTLSFDANGAPVGTPLMWMERVTETPALGTTETWEIYNFTEDAHPIHIHLVQFQVVERQAADGTVRGPETWESGYKDTLVAYPGEITRFRAKFDKRGRYVWHCHILEHEDNEMMRPYVVG